MGNWRQQLRLGQEIDQRPHCRRQLRPGDRQPRGSLLLPMLLLLLLLLPGGASMRRAHALLERGGQPGKIVVGAE